MRIKQIELLGFKSFKDKTVLSFPAGITAIVGPNGCGKSNVVDALRWVLGEQSIRHLRGHEMGDVVFAGTAGNTPLGMAEVNLLLENTVPQMSRPEAHANGVGNGSNGTHIDGTNGSRDKIEENIESPPPPNFKMLGTNPEKVGNGNSLGNWTEMMVSRRYFRSGESEYLLNKIPCRLRDVVEFFLGTGAGTKAYSIIEQGRVDHLINAKPDEIRVLIEEAAGVSLYRSRRLAAERKLERTQDNLARVADLLHEMERQLGSLRRQAKKADQYQMLQEELKTVDLTLQCKGYQTLLDELQTLGARRNEVVQESGRLSDEFRQLQADREQALMGLEEEEVALHTEEERCHTLESSLQQGEQRKQFFLQQEQRATARATATETELSGLDERQALVHKDIESLSRLASHSQRELHEEETILQAQEQENAGHQQALLESEAVTEEFKTGIVDLLTQKAQVQNSLTHSRRRAKEVEQRLHVLSDEAERISGVLIETEQRLSSTQSRAAQLREDLLIGQRQRVEKTGGLRQAVRVAERLEEDLAAARAKQAELRTRLSTLEEMEQGYERYAPGVQSVMSNVAAMTDAAKNGEEGTSAQVLGVVAQMLEVPHAYERAVAAVLREKLEYVVVADVGDGLAAIEYLRTAEAGRGSFIPRRPRRTDRGQSLEPQTGQTLTVGRGSSVAISAPLSKELNGAPLLSFLSIEPECRDVVETLLEDTVLVPDLQTGLRLWKNGYDDGHAVVPVTFVTLEGEVLSAEGVVSGGSEGFAEEGLLERGREIRDLHQQVEQHEHVVSGLVGSRQKAKHSQQELEGELARLDADALALGQKNETLQREAGQLEGEQRRLLDKKESTSYEHQTLDEEHRTLGTEIETLSTHDAQIEVLRRRQEIQLAEKQSEVAQVKVALEQHRTVCDDLRIRVAARRERHEGMRAQRLRLHEQRRELADRLASCHAEREAAQGEGEKIRSDLTELAHRLVQQAGDLDAARHEQNARRESCAEFRTTCREYEERLERGRIAQAEFQGEKTRLEVSIAEKRVSGEHLDATVRERYEVSILQVLTEYGEGDIEIAEGEQRRQELRDKLAWLGEVNPGAASELSEIEERQIFLKSQESDLNTSISDLQNTITKLNRESRDRFKETFILVDEKFRAVYERLVEGGKAQIALTDENDLTSSGVEISVQPPGKRLRSLQLLSGGEKALAALSFTFALFLIRPSPFCVLDEVDAPLDDANVGRFNQLVREMSASTQVVLITHNKRTMEAASTLYGVTMQEPGVSTVVSVSMS